MTAPSKEDPSAAARTLEAAIADRLSAADRKLLQATPAKSWPKLRIVFIGCEEAGELVELIPEMNRVMKTCPAMILSRAHKGEITQAQGTEGYAQLHDSVNSVRNAQNTMLYLAGFRVPDPFAAKSPAKAAADAPGPAPQRGAVAVRSAAS